jgi:hypothetical protein
MGQPSAKPGTPDLLEWTITEASPDGEAAPLSVPLPFTASSPTPVAKPRPKFDLWSWLFWAAALGFVGWMTAGLWLTPALSWQRTRSDVARIVAQEERAALAKQPEAVTKLSDAYYQFWAEAQAQRARNGLAAPLPLPMLRPVPEAGHIQSFAAIDSDTIQVDVARRFTTPEGIPYTFALSQFYRFDGKWWRVPAPEQFWGDKTSRSGQRITVRYYAVDEALAAELIPYLDDVLARACANWVCSDEFDITLNLTSTYYQSGEALPALLPDDPLLFAMLPPHVSRWPNYVVHFPSPHAAGYPVEASGKTLLKRAIAIQILFAAADRLAFVEGGQPDETGNAFFYALVARLAAHLDLDQAPSTLSLTTPTRAAAPLTTDKIWGLRFQVGRRPESVRNALALLNQVLADQGQPTQTDVELLRTFGAAPSLADWLSAGMGIPPTEAEARVELAQRQLNSDMAPAP